MPHLKGVQVAIELATRQRDAASAALLLVQRGYFGARNQMGQLESYAAETESNWALASRPVAQAEIVRHYDHFMGRLQQAVDMQRAVVGDHLAAVAVAKKTLLEAEIRVAALERLLAKRRTLMARQRDGREQRQLDELSALQFRRLHAGSEHLGTP